MIDYYAVCEHAARMTGLIQRVSIYDLRTMALAIRAAIEMEQEQPKQKDMSEALAACAKRESAEGKK